LKQIKFNSEENEDNAS